MKINHLLNLSSFVGNSQRLFCSQETMWNVYIKFSVVQLIFSFNFREEFSLTRNPFPSLNSYKFPSTQRLLDLPRPPAPSYNPSPGSTPSSPTVSPPPPLGLPPLLSSNHSSHPIQAIIHNEYDLLQLWFYPLHVNLEKIMLIYKYEKSFKTALVT